MKEFYALCDKFTEKIFLKIFDEIFYISHKGGYNMGDKSK